MKISEDQARQEERKTKRAAWRKAWRAKRRLEALKKTKLRNPPAPGSLSPKNEEQIRRYVWRATPESTPEGLLEITLASLANTRQVGGDHYKGDGTLVEHWDIAIMHKMDFFQYQVTKYVMRWKKKNGVKDLEKAMHFIQKYIEVHKEFGPTEGIKNVGEASNPQSHQDPTVPPVSPEVPTQPRRMARARKAGSPRDRKRSPRGARSMAREQGRGLGV
jgi:hypothetical protein